MPPVSGKEDMIVLGPLAGDVHNLLVTLAEEGLGAILAQQVDMGFLVAADVPPEEEPPVPGSGRGPDPLHPFGLEGELLGPVDLLALLVDVYPPSLGDARYVRDEGYAPPFRVELGEGCGAVFRYRENAYVPFSTIYGH